MRASVHVASAEVLHLWPGDGEGCLRVVRSGAGSRIVGAGVLCAAVAAVVRGEDGTVRVVLDVEDEGLEGGDEVDVGEVVGSVIGMRTVVVCGREGWAEGGRKGTWGEDCVTGGVLVGDGGVWRAGGGRGRDGVFVVGYMGGRVVVGAVRSGERVGRAIGRGGRVVAELGQEVLAVSEDGGGGVVCAVGCFGKGCFLFEEGRQVKVSFFFIGVAGRKVRREDVRIVGKVGGGMVVENLASSRFATAELSVGEGSDCESLSVSVSTRAAAASGGGIGVAFDGKNVAMLLRGIDNVGAERESVARRVLRAERKLSSVNAALVFAIAWKRGGGLGVDCEVTGGCSGLTGLTGWSGKSAVLRVRLRNRAGVEIGDGWTVVVEVRAARKGIVCRYSAPVGSVRDNDWREYPFTLPVVSHRALNVSIVLVYFRYAEGRASAISGAAAGSNLNFRSPSSSCSAGNAAEALLRVPLVEGRQMDVIDFSVDTNSEEMCSDHSHCLLPSSRIADFFDPENDAKRRQPLSSSSRIVLPLSVDALNGGLFGASGIASDGVGKVSNPLTSGAGSETVGSEVIRRRKSALGAFFELSISRLEEDSSVVKLRAPAHVLCFLRGAVMRRAGPLILAHRKSAYTASSVHRPALLPHLSRREVVDATDEALGKLREAESRVVDAKRWACNEGAGVLGVVGEGDHRVVGAALQAVREAYANWRSSGSDLLR